MKDKLRFCTICGKKFYSEFSLETVCSNPCNEKYESDLTEFVDTVISHAVPKALEVLGFDSIDDYALAKEERKKGYIYFIQLHGYDRLIKIGFSQDVKNRLRELQTGSPCVLEVIGKHQGTRADETQLHKRFYHHRIRGEWFNPGDDLLDYISEFSEL